MADFKGMRCRETGIAQEVFNKMGMRTVNMPGGEIMPAAERGVIDCAEWVGDLQTAFLSPPVAMSAYYLRNVVPQWSLGLIYRGMGDFMIIQVICLAIVMLFPDIVLWLPRSMR